MRPRWSNMGNVLLTNALYYAKYQCGVIQLQPRTLYGTCTVYRLVYYFSRLMLDDALIVDETHSRPFL